MTIQLALAAAWNPGQHGSEMAVPEQDPQALGGVKYRREPSEKFQKKPRGLAGRLELYRQGAASNREH